MSSRAYLPSAKFAVMLGALLTSGGLVLAAQYVTRPAPVTATLSAEAQAAQAAQAANWQQVLRDIEAQSGIQAPEPADEVSVNTLLDAAQSSNLTTEVGRTLLINLSAANSQGLGSDLPTQEQLISQAAAQISAKSVPAKVYTSANLTIVNPTKAALRAYGNGLILAALAHPKANVESTYEVMGYATDYQDPARFASFKSMAAEYRALASDMAALSVPSTLAPLHLSLVNDLAAMAETYTDMQRVFDDPLRGLTGLRQFESLADESSRVFINIGQTLSKDGILFTKDEPGAAWSALLAT